MQKFLSIEWIYEDSDSARETGKAEGAEYVIPPQEEIQALFRLAMRGNLEEISSAVDVLEHSDSALLPFTKKIREFVKGFHINQIREFLKQYLDE